MSRSRDRRLEADELQNLDDVRDVVAQSLQRRDEQFTHLYAGRSKGYIDGSMRLHIHVRIRPRDRSRPCGEFCVLVKTANESDLFKEEFDVLRLDDAHGEVAKRDTRQSERTMLVHVVEFGQDPQWVCQGVVSTVRSLVRLNPLNECEDFRRDIAADRHDLDYDRPRRLWL